MKVLWLREQKVKNSFSQTPTRAIDSSDGKILELIKENFHISVSEISRVVGLGMTTGTKNSSPERRNVERKGFKKTGQWIVKP